MFKLNHIPRAWRKSCKGALVVKIKERAQLGNSDTYLEVGTIGFVQSRSREGRSVVYFPWVSHSGVVLDTSYEIIGRQPA